MFSFNTVTVCYISLALFSMALSSYINIVSTSIQTRFVEYAILMFVRIAINYASVHVTSLFAEKFVIMYYNECWTRIQSMSRTSRELLNKIDFAEKLNNVIRAIRSKYYWGIRTILTFLASIIGFVVISWQQEKMYIPGIYVLVYIMWYFVIYKHMMDNFTEYQKTEREQRNALADKESILLGRIFSDQCTVNDIMNCVSERCNNVSEYEEKCNNLEIIQKVPDSVLLLIIALTTDSESALSLFMVCTSITYALDSLMVFVNQYKKMSNDTEVFEDLWKDKVYNEVHEQLPIPDIVSFYGSFTDSGNTIVTTVPDQNLIIEQGNIYMLKGNSGSGKTLLQKMIQGHVKGGNFTNNVHPLSYASATEYMSQDAGCEIIVNRSTLRQLFYDDYHSESIIEALKVVFLHDWFETTMNGNLDAVLKNKISGGEKVRLCLAIAVQRAKKAKCQWLVVDEPDVGVQPDLFPKVMNNIIDYLPNTTMFLTLHLCECKLPQIKKISKVWLVKNHEVRVVEREYLK